MNKNKSVKVKNNNVETAYASSHANAIQMAEKVIELLNDMPAPGTTIVNWGHVGSINHVTSRLAELVEFLNGDNQ